MLKILGCGRNVSKYLVRYIHSLERQTYSNFEAYLILDNPTDDSADVAVRAANQSKRHITVQVNNERKHQPRNFYEGIHRACSNKEDICCIIDLDDYVLPFALEKVAKKYELYPECLVTFGTFLREGRADLEFQGDLPNNNKYRKNPWITSHMKTFKYKLFEKMSSTNFKDHTGEWFKRTGDQALMYPLLEMAGRSRIQRIKDVIYILNGEVKTYPPETEKFKVHEVVRAREPYKCTFEPPPPFPTPPLRCIKGFKEITCKDCTDDCNNRREAYVKTGIMKKIKTWVE